MKGARRGSLVGLLVVLCGGAGVAETSERSSVSGWREGPRLVIGVESGAYSAQTDELVEARPEYAAKLLSHLAWEAGGDFIGINLSYGPAGVFRANGGVWSLMHTRAGHVVDLDYLDATSAEVTHRSVSVADFAGVGWKFSMDAMLVEAARGAVFLRGFARLEYRGNYHVWNAHGGTYVYRGMQGRFDDDQHLVRYAVRHQALHGGVFLEFGQAAGDGLYGRIGGTASLLSWAEDRDTHVLSDTDYHNTYGLGWYLQPEIAVGVGLGRRVAVEAF